MSKPRRWSTRAETIFVVVIVCLISAVLGLIVRGLDYHPRGNPDETVRLFATVPEYERARFGDWVDADGDCQDTRDEVLMRDLETFALDERGCHVVRGVLIDPYTGERVDFLRGRATSRAVQIDHVVPLRAAWYAGAHAWNDETREAYANDLDNLVASKGSVNGAKGAQLPTTWTERITTDAGCDYLVTVLTVSSSWDLDLPPAEDSFVGSAVNQCPTPLTTR